MNNEHPELKNFMRRIDAGAARLNPGLSAIAIVLLTVVTGQAATRLVSLWAEELATQTVQLTTDPTSFAPSDIFPDD